MVCLPSLLSRPPVMSPDLRINIKRTFSMKQEFFPFVWNSDVTHQLTRCQIPTSVSLNGTNLQQDVFGIHAVLEPHLVASFTNVLQPICVREFSPSGLLECSPQFQTHRIPMNSAPISWCWNMECHLVAFLEDTLLGFG